MKVYTVNDDGVVLLPDYMAKAVMSNDDALEVTEVEDKKSKKQQPKIDQL